MTIKNKKVHNTKTANPVRKFFEARLRIEGEKGEQIAKFIDAKMESEHRLSRVDTVIAYLLEASSANPNRERVVPYQCCPKCNGQGIVSLPPYANGDAQVIITTATSFGCDVCFGAKIIPMHIVK